MKGFYHIWAWRPSWSCDLDFLYTHWFPLPIDASYKIWLWLAKRFQRRRSLKLWTDDGRRTPDHGHPISSPCEPNGSGELIMGKFICHEWVKQVCEILHMFMRLQSYKYHNVIIMISYVPTYMYIKCSDNYSHTQNDCYMKLLINIY